MHFICSQTQCRPGGVHRHISSSHHGHLLTLFNGSVIIGEFVGLHQVDPGEVLIGRVDAAQVLAGDIEKSWCSGADPQEYGIVAALEKLIYLDLFAHHRVQLQLSAEGLDILDLRADDPLGQAELGNSVDQDPSALVQGLEDGDLVAHSGQVCSAGEPCGTGAHNSSALA